MSPLDFARNLAQSDSTDDVVLGVAMMTRGLTDDDPANFRQGWPLNKATVERAATFLGVGDISDGLIEAVIEKAPTISDAMLNKRG